MKINLILAALLLAASAGLAAWVRIRKTRETGAVATWAEAKARILSHDIDERFGTDNEGRPDYDYLPRIRYRYEAGGSVRTGSRIAFESDCFANASAAQRRLAQWPVGSDMPVYINSADCDDALLRRDTRAAGGSSSSWWCWRWRSPPACSTKGNLRAGLSARRGSCRTALTRLRTGHASRIPSRSATRPRLRSAGRSRHSCARRSPG
jgi:hypothetical protein